MRESVSPCVRVSESMRERDLMSPFVRESPTPCVRESVSACMRESVCESASVNERVSVHV